MPDLSPKHRKFAEFYLCNGFDPRAAYIAAGYSPRSADSEAYKLLHKAEIQAFINQRMRPITTAESLLQRLVDVAFFNLTDVITFDETSGLKLRSLSDLPPHMTACIESIHEDANGKLSIKCHSAIAALRILAKHFAIDSNPNEVLNQARGLGFDVVDQFATGEGDDGEAFDD